MVEKMSTENRFSEDKDKLSLVPVLQQSGRYQAQRPYQQGQRAYQKLPIQALKDELVYQLSSRIRMNWHTLEISHKYHERAKSVLYRINLRSEERRVGKE